MGFVGGRVSAYYNEIDPLKAEIIRQAILDGAIAPGDVDERSIADVEPADLVGYTQAHFFAGGGFWSLALRQAGWPDDRPVWTGSCPCPGFSVAGKGGGFSDPRHLWPAWARLIRECHPPTIFGEQVSAAIGHGWLDLVQTDLEAQDYAVGKIVLGACSIGAPHIRQRLYFVANAERCRLERKSVRQSSKLLKKMDEAARPWSATSAYSASPSSMANATDARRQTARQHNSGQSLLPARSEQCGDAGIVENSRCWKQSECGDAIKMSVERNSTTGSTDSVGRPSTDRIVEHAESGGLGMRGGASGDGRHAAQPSELGGVGNAGRTGLPDSQPEELPGARRGQEGRAVAEPSEAAGGLGNPESNNQRGNSMPRAYGEGLTAGESGGDLRPGPLNGYWANADWIGCRDGKFRPVEPGTFPLASGYPGRVGLLRLAGDAICVSAAQAFIESYLEVERDEK
jgi:DNA (cytosine-5)-methyltransferase 1